LSVTRAKFSDTEPGPAGTVLLVCPGGLEHGGGIGRQMGYFLRSRRGRNDGLAYEIVDTRGPWFLGAARFHMIFSGVYLASALAKLAVLRLRPGLSILHVNITGRGSTVRKIVLLTFARVLRQRYLLHVHDYDYADEYRKRGILMRSLIAQMFRRAESILVLSVCERDALSSLLELPSHRLVVFHNAVPDPRPDPLPQRRHDEPPHLLFLGRLSDRKGVPELLQALGTASLKSRRWRATLAGGGPIGEYRRLAADLGISERVDFRGWLDAAAVAELYADADLLVLPSHAEGLAMSVLEALSYGLAVVATPVGAHREVIEPEVSGILVPPGDAEALAAALLRVIEDEGLRHKLGAAARRRFLENFDLRIYAERLARLHASLVAGSGTVGAAAEGRVSP
jgi:glycosyltransferase involved in cell wall biosynthesis